MCVCVLFKGLRPAADPAIAPPNKYIDQCPWAILSHLLVFVSFQLLPPHSPPHPKNYFFHDLLNIYIYDFLVRLFGGGNKLNPEVGDQKWPPQIAT